MLSENIKVILAEIVSRRSSNLVFLMPTIFQEPHCKRYACAKHMLFFPKSTNLCGTTHIT